MAGAPKKTLVAQVRDPVPRARLTGEDGKTREWRSGSLRACQRRTRAADALIAAARFATVLVQPTATIRGRADLQNPPRCVRRRPNPLPARDRLSDPAHARSVE